MTGGSIGDNTATEFGAGLYALGSLSTVKLTGVTVANNNVGGGIGGGPYNESGSLTLIGSVVRANRAAIAAGIDSIAAPPTCAATLALTNTAVSGNIAASTGGEVDIFAACGTATTTITDSTIGPGNTAAGGVGGGGIVNQGNNAVPAVPGIAALAMTGGSIVDNSATVIVPDPCAGGGGLFNLGSGGTATATLTNVLISGNTVGAGSGGGAFNCDATLALNGGTVRGNSAAALGGGISNVAATVGRTTTATLHGTAISDNSAGSGGGIDNSASGGTATLAIADSTIDGNTSPFGTASVRNDGTSAGVVSATITNSTLAGNSGDNGALMVIADAGTSVTATLTNVTIAGNTATTAGFGAGLQIRDRGALGGTASVTLRNSILANSAGPNIALIGPGAALASGGYNISDDNSGVGHLAATGDAKNTSPLLAPAGLTDNGGPPRTMALLPGSPAIYRVPTSGANCPGFDQRGVVRPRASACDSGAYEADQIATTLAVAPAAGVYGGTVDLAATLTRGGVPIANQTIAFTLNGTPAGTAVTNAGGVATLNNASLGTIPAGTYPTGTGASFAGGGGYLPASGTAALTITKASTATTTPNATATYGDAAGERNQLQPRQRRTGQRGHGHLHREKRGADDLHRHIGHREQRHCLGDLPAGDPGCRELQHRCDLQRRPELLRIERHRDPAGAAPHPLGEAGGPHGGAQAAQPAHRPARRSGLPRAWLLPRTGQGQHLRPRASPGRRSI